METPKTWADFGIELPLGRSGEVDVLCPKCSHLRRREHQRHKCLSVNADEGTWFCHNCGWKGALPADDWRKPYREPRTYRKPVMPSEVRTPAAEKWLADRGIGPTVAQRNQVSGSADELWFPFVRNGEVVTVKHRAMREKKFWLTKDAEQIPFGWDDCAGQPVVVVVEGEIDKLTIEQCTGWEHVVSPPNGSKPSDQVFEHLATICEAADKVILAGDMDQPGREFMQELSTRIGLDRCWTVTWPAKDANDTLRDFDEAMVRSCLFNARPIPVAGIVSMDDLSDAVDELYANGMPGGDSTGWPGLDRHYTVRRGQVTTLTGSPMSGKSVWLDALLVNLARASGWKLGICSPEFQPLARHEAHLLSCYVGKPFGAGPTQRMSVEEKDDAKRWLKERFWFVMPEETTLDAVLDRARVLVRRHGITGFVLDPWNDLEDSRPSGVTETEFIHGALRKIRTFARNHECHVWIVAHPRKLIKEGGKYPVASPYDIAGSAGFYNKSDNCLSLWRDFQEEMKPVELHVQKIKFHEIGGLGKVLFRHDRLTGRYWETIDR